LIADLRSSKKKLRSFKTNNETEIRIKMNNSASENTNAQAKLMNDGDDDVFVYVGALVA
jgi:phage-related protein